MFKDSANSALITADVPIHGIGIDGISLVVHVLRGLSNGGNPCDLAEHQRTGKSVAVVTLTASKHQKPVLGLTSRAGVTLKSIFVNLLRTEFMRVTGVKEPSGIPYVAPNIENKEQIAGIVSLVQIQHRNDAH